MTYATGQVPYNPAADDEDEEDEVVVERKISSSEEGMCFSATLFKLLRSLTYFDPRIFKWIAIYSGGHFFIRNSFGNNSSR